MKEKAIKYARIDQTYLPVLYGQGRSDPANLVRLNRFAKLYSPDPSSVQVVTIEQLADLLNLKGTTRQDLIDVAKLYQEAFAKRRVYRQVLREADFAENQMTSVYYDKMHNLIYEYLKNRYLGLDPFPI